MMKTFFQGVADFFSTLLSPMEYLRLLENENWWTSNFLNFIFLGICFIAMIYWLKKLKIFDKEGTEDKSVTSHSYL